MIWQDITDQWSQFSEQASTRWPLLRPADVLDTGGDFHVLAALLATTYDLTLMEAEETVEDWSMTVAPQIVANTTLGQVA